MNNSRKLINLLEATEHLLKKFLLHPSSEWYFIEIKNKSAASTVNFTLLSKGKRSIVTVHS